MYYVEHDRLSSEDPMRWSLVSPQTLCRNDPSEQNSTNHSHATRSADVHCMGISVSVIAIHKSRIKTDKTNCNRVVGPESPNGSIT